MAVLHSRKDESRDLAEQSDVALQIMTLNSTVHRTHRKMRCVYDSPDTVDDDDDDNSSSSQQQQDESDY